MNHIIIYFACVFAAFVAVTFGLIFVARATKWKPKPMKPIRGALVIFGAVLVAGSVCAIAGRDIHILYWWLIGAPATIAFLAVLCAAMNLLAGWLARRR